MKLLLEEISRAAKDVAGALEGGWCTQAVAIAKDITVNSYGKFLLPFW